MAGVRVAVAVLGAAQVVKPRVGPAPGIAVSVVATVALAGVARRAGLTRAQVGLGVPQARRGVRYGAVSGVAVACVYAVGAALPRTRRLFADRRAEPTLPGVLRQALVDVPLGTVLLEEWAFRGVLPTLLAPRYGRRRADAMAATLFGLWHVMPSVALAEANPALARASAAGLNAGGVPRPATDSGHATTTRRATGTGDDPRSGPGRLATVAGNVAVTTVAGVGFGLLRRRSGSLLAPALAHTALNSLGFLAAHLVNRAATRRSAARAHHAPDHYS
ncbi:CPBP family intramembrane metalloprotease [Streptomyces sp. JJ66]|uniref:CPBP family intramembrane glutamic endopeptidase n=1 Tax=Streptomyces sp. JJ66 TaxID=2803843 RepID=UPI001C5975EF|nr:CPBP family intramembrane glutamic endopeptidase [Streptomyces sp. JJ66]MBW1604551.1 CPBP family intramembrane metalloprotease [Streptomyces sp. JJ66]